MRVPSDFFCPHCGRQIEPELGCVANRLREAIVLQSQRLGTEIRCPHCQRAHIVRRVPPDKEPEVYDSMGRAAG